MTAPLPDFVKALLARGQVRETARATAELVRRKITVPTTVGATVTEVQPGTGVVSVHLDGDPPGQSVPVACDWLLYQVGQRVIVHQYPPSGAVVLGPADPPAPWIDYPAGADAWYSADHYTPTIGLADSTTDYPVTNPTTTIGPVSLTAGQLVVVAIGTRTLGGTSKYAASIANSGAPLAWAEKVARTGLYNSFAIGDVATAASLWWAYVPVTQSVNITITWSDQVTGAECHIAVLDIDNADPLQIGAGSNSDEDAGSTASVSVTTTVDRSQIVGVAVGVDNDFNPPWTWTASAGCTKISEETASGYAGEVVLRRSSGVTTPGATNIGAQGGGTGGAEEMISVAMEIIGTPSIPDIGTGELIANYRVYDKTMHLGLSIEADGTTDFGAGPLVPRLPPGFVAATRKPIQSIGGYLLPTGAAGNGYRLRAFILGGEAVFRRTSYSDAATQAMDATHPVALGAGTLLCYDGAIEID